MRLQRQSGIALAFHPAWMQQGWQMLDLSFARPGSGSSQPLPEAYEYGTVTSKK